MTTDLSTNIPCPGKALTLHAPWAWAVVNGVKQVENRDWTTTYRGAIFVHAGLSFESDAAARELFSHMQVKPPNEFARGVILGTIDLVDVLPLTEYLQSFASLPFLHKLAIGPWCWVLSNPRICEPVPHPGNFQLWPVKLPPERFRFIEPKKTPNVASIPNIACDTQTGNVGESINKNNDLANVKNIEQPNLLPLPGLPPMSLQDVFDKLLAHYGPQRWWPAESALEVIVGLILVRNSQWSVARRVIDRLKSENLMQVSALKELPEDQMLGIIRPVGRQKTKAATIRCFVAEISEKWNGFLLPFLSRETQVVRDELLALPGIGPETADMALLYAGNHPVCPVDAYTKRILVRHNLVDEKSTSDEISRFMLDLFGRNTFIFNELHALFVQAGRDFCLKSAPKCQHCPLNLLKPPNHHFNDVL